MWVTLTSKGGYIFHGTGHVCEKSGGFPTQRNITIWNFEVCFDGGLDNASSPRHETHWTLMWSLWYIIKHLYKACGAFFCCAYTIRSLFIILPISNYECCPSSVGVNLKYMLKINRYLTLTKQNKARVACIILRVPHMLSCSIHVSNH